MQWTNSLAGMIEHAPDIGLVDLMAGDRHVDVEVTGKRLARRKADQDLLDALARHVLGGFDRLADLGFGGLHVDHKTRPHAARNLMADADDLDGSVVLGPGDETADLGGSHIKGGNQSVSLAWLGHAFRRPCRAVSTSWRREWSARARPAG
jgi:hypothetical protein